MNHSSISIHHNTYIRSKKIPDLGHEIGQLLFAKFWRDIPDIVYDGMPDPQFLDSNGNVLDGHNLCIQNNNGAEFVNLEIDRHFNKWYSPLITKFPQSITPFDCALTPLEATRIITK